MDSNIATTIVVLVIVLSIYFLPSAVAGRNNPRSGAVYVINLFFGWTLLGWVIALAMAMSSPSLKRCPKCAERVSQDALICRYCHHDLEEDD